MATDPTFDTRIAIVMSPRRIARLLALALALLGSGCRPAWTCCAASDDGQCGYSVGAGASCPVGPPSPRRRGPG